jgi:hypothetical protein
MKPVIGVIARLIQEQTGVFAEQIQGWHLYVLRYLASVFGNSVGMLIAMLGLSGHSNRYRATVAMICNTEYSGLPSYYCSLSGPSVLGLFYGLSLSRILAIVIIGSVMSGRSMVPAMFTTSSRYYRHHLSTSLQLNYKASSPSIRIRGLQPGIQILLEFQMLRTWHLFCLQIWLILSTSLLLS